MSLAFIGNNCSFLSIRLHPKSDLTTIITGNKRHSTKIDLVLSATATPPEAALPGVGDAHSTVNVQQLGKQQGFSDSRLWTTDRTSANQAYRHALSAAGIPVQS